MLCPATVSAVAAALWLLTVLGPDLSDAAEDNSEPGFSLCSHCFYKQTPPKGAPAGPLLHPFCHSLPGGQAFATLSNPTCGTAVYSAFHLSHGWTEREGQEDGDLVTEKEENTEVVIPALLRGSEDAYILGSPTNSRLKLWDSTVTVLVQSIISPQCSSLQGDLYILIGVGGFKAAEDGDECKTKPLWSTVCCAAPEGKGDFSLGLIVDAEERERHVSLKELEETLGVAELFSEGCGGAYGETVGITLGLHSIGPTGFTGEANEGEETGSGTTSQDPHEAVIAEEPVAGVDAHPDVKQHTSTDASSLGGSYERQSNAVRSESSESLSEGETVEEQETDTNSSSTLGFILTTTLSILKVPLKPVFSTITQLPGQVTYVLQEDLGVLSVLPGDTFSFLHLLTSDLLSWMGTAADILLGVGETCFCNAYHCTSSMLGELLNSCYTGVTGMGTLAGDTVGIFGNTLDSGWRVTKFFGGCLWEQSTGYVGTVMSEMGGQAKAAGGGLGRLVWRSGNGVGNIFSVGGGLIMGIMDKFMGTVQEAFGQEYES